MSAYIRTRGRDRQMQEELFRSRLMKSYIYEGLGLNRRNNGWMVQGSGLGLIRRNNGWMVQGSGLGLNRRNNGWLVQGSGLRKDITYEILFCLLSVYTVPFRGSD